MVANRNEVTRGRRWGPRSSRAARVRAAERRFRARAGVPPAGARSTTLIDPSKLDARAREELTKRLYAVHTQIFGGLDQKGFDKYVVNSPAEDTRLLLYQDAQGDLVGYFGTHRFEKSFDGRQVIAYRSEVGLLPGHRQKRAPLAFLARQATRYKLLHPWRTVYFLSCPVSPSSYAVIARYTRVVYPTHDKAVPAEILRLMASLADQFQLVQVDPAYPLARRVGWTTRATATETAFWQSSTNPHIRFYLAMNPRFAEGNGLLTLTPLTITNGVLTLARFGMRTLRKRFRAWS